MDTPHPPKSRVNIALNHDYISKLPPDIKGKILVNLPIKEAVRTSTLSSKWIDSWTSIPNLVFVENNTEPGLIKLADMVLLVHEGPIEIFKLVSNHACNGAIGRWMFILSRNGIKDLELSFYNHERCKIPFRLLSCNALERLYLSDCSINVPRCFRGFKLMRTLTLHNLDLSGVSIGNLVSSCPLLEHLSLFSYDHLGCLDIFAPNLTSLSILGDIHDLCLETPKLVAASIFLLQHNRDYQRESNITRALGCLSNIQRLDILGDFSNYLAMGPIPENLPHIFNYLTEISFHLPINPYDIAVALCLFQNAPNLEVIDIEFWPSRRTDQPKLQASWEVKAIHDSSLLKGLKVVKLMRATFTELSLQNTKSILEFAKLMLSTAPALEKLNISGLEEAKVTFEMLNCFPKLSKKTEILFVS